MRRFFLWCLTRKRSFRVSILSLFLSLFLVSFALILTFTYTKDYRAMLVLSQTISDEMARHLRFHFTALSQNAEETVQAASGFLPAIGPLGVNNPILLSYLVNTLASDPSFANLYMGFPNGDLVGAFNIYDPYHDTFLLDPEKRLPPNVKYELRFVDRQTAPATIKIHYLDAQFNVLSTEILPNTDFVATKRPWYKGAVAQSSSFWTDVYDFDPGPQRGISIGRPLLNSQGDVSAVIGADLSLSLLSKIVKELKVGQGGKTLILDKEGNLVVPNTSNIITGDLIKTVFNYYQANPGKTNQLIDYQGISFLTFRTEVATFFGAKWSVLVITPLNDFLSNLIETQHQILLLIFLMTLICIVIIVRFSARISHPITILASEINKIKNLNLTSHMRIRSSIREIYELDQSIASMRYVVLSFSKYVPKELVKNLFLLNKEISLGGEKKEVTIFFSDVANFTTIAESKTIEVLLPLVSEYFQAMTSIILKLEGTIDKFIGDGIMAFWGAPLAVKDHAQKACDAALLCHAMLVSFNKNRAIEGKPEFPTRFGIHSGEVIVGNIGTEDRMNYTVLGDAVNTTARLQEVDKIYHTSIIISEQVYAHLPSSYIARPLDLVTVKGKTKKIKIYELIGKMHSYSEIAPSSAQIELCTQFTRAYEAMEKNQVELARSLFSEIAKRFPKDFPTQIYLERLKKPQG